jgi:cytochrome c553
MRIRTTLRNVVCPLRIGARAMLLTLAAAGHAAGQAATAEPVSVVKQFYMAAARGKVAAPLDNVSETAEWTVHGPAYALPFVGVFHGRSGVADFFRGVADTLADVQTEQREFIASADKVLVLGSETGTVRSTHGRYRADTVQSFTVRDGKIIRFEQIADYSELLDAMAAADPQRGKALFVACAGCHGGSAEGVAALNAPLLAGLDSDYIVRELRMFRSGLRGNTADTYGYMMTARAGTLPGDRAVRDVAAYIATLPVAASASSTLGDPVRGKALYESCAACHGSEANGNAVNGSPGLRNQNDAYLRNQLRNFRSGVRGLHPEDAGGVQMRAAALLLTNPRDIEDVIAFINSR